MKKFVALLLFLFPFVGFGQLTYKQDLDSLAKCFQNAYFTCNYSSHASPIQLVSKYHPAYIQTDVGDGTEVITEEMVKANGFYKAVSKNTRSVIVLSSPLPYGWVMVVDLKKLNLNNIQVRNDTVVISDSVNGFKSNVSHRLWKGFVTTTTFKIFSQTKRT